MKTGLIYGVKHNGAQTLIYTYDALARISSRNLQTGTIFVTEYTYLEGATPNSTTTLVKTMKVGSDTYGYTYDDLGNITSITKNGTVVESYEYDSLSQLTKVTNSTGVYVYTYDNGGNILSVTKDGEEIKDYTYGDTSWKDLLTAFNGDTITYDNIGNPLTYRDGMSFTWQNGRQLASVGNNISYTYNADGNRISKTVNGTTTEYFWLDGVLLGEKTGTNTILYLYDDNGVKYGFDLNGTRYYYILNLQGDVIGILNSAGVQVVSYTYDAWGNLLSTTGSQASTIGQLNPIRYRGYYYDAETEFYFLNTRYYDPETGRFINADGLISTGQGLLSTNMFAYCLSNPVNMFDPTGDFAISAMLGGIAIWKIGAVVVGLIGTVILADTIAKNPPVLPSLSIPEIDLKPKSESKAKDIAPVIPKNPPKNTVIYRYGGTNPGNFVPSKKDVETNSGLSFSTLPPPPWMKATVTTIEALNATGVVRAYQDRPGHVRVDPVLGSLASWRAGGSMHPCTIAVKSVVVKWDGGF